MSSENLKKLLAALPQLEPLELQALLNHAKIQASLMKPSITKATVTRDIKRGDLDLGEDWLLEGIKRCLVADGILSRNSGILLQRTIQNTPSFVRESPKVRAQLLKMLTPPVSEERKLRLGSMAAKAMLMHHKERQRPITAHLMLRSISIAPYTLNKCFPGYAEMGLLDLVIPSRKRMKNG